MDRDKLVAQVRKDLENRASWDDRQSKFYAMRHHGLRRTNKPWPNASDVHFPLIDTAIEKLKPAYFQQAFALENLAAFEADTRGALAYATQVAEWFDYQLRHRSNFETQLLRLIDHLLCAGRAVMKSWWSVADNRLRFRAVRPQHIIVPPATPDLADADRITHVLLFSVDGYKRQSSYAQGDDVLRQIVGAGVGVEQDGTEQDRFDREGITFDEADRIILWEVWTRKPDGGWRFSTVAPVAPSVHIRPDADSDAEDGSHPFTAFATEEKEDGFYSPRGIPEILAVFEAQCCKIWNEKNDAMTLYNRPLFRADKEGPNIGNLRWEPGQILPYGVYPVQMPSPPISWDQELMQTRDVAERRVAVPDFGMSSTRSTRDSRTATEIDAIMQQSGQSADLRMRVFRLGLSAVFTKAWHILRQYAGDQLAYFVDGNEQAVPPDALAMAYRVGPSGSADAGNRGLMLQKAWSRFQAFKGDPYVDQGELRKCVLEVDDPQLVRRLYRDPETGEATAAEEQALEILAMRIGATAVVSQADDHGAHIRQILAYVKSQAEAGESPGRQEMALLFQHTREHLELLRQLDPQQAQAAEDAIRMVFQMLVAQRGEQQGEEVANVA